MKLIFNKLDIKNILFQVYSVEDSSGLPVARVQAAHQRVRERKKEISDATH